MHLIYLYVALVNQLRAKVQLHCSATAFLGDPVACEGRKKPLQRNRLGNPMVLSSGGAK
jgi:hypothetical protein